MAGLIKAGLSVALDAVTSVINPWLLGGVAAAVAALWGWHLYDKHAAVIEAKEGLVSKYELAAAQAELAALQRDQARLAEANQELSQKLQEAQSQRATDDQEVADYVSTVGDDCQLGGALLERLHDP